jgi:hypothetical protein
MKLTPTTKIILSILTILFIAVGVWLEIRMRSAVDDLVEQIGENTTGSLDLLSPEDLEALIQRVNSKGEVYSDEELEERLFELIGTSDDQEEAADK